MKPDSQRPASVYKHSGISKTSTWIRDFPTGLEASNFCRMKEADENHYFHDHYIWFPKKDVND